MKFPNLSFAIAERRLSDWEVAREVGMTPWAFSRRKTGQVQFNPTEKARIAAFLGFDSTWLFARPTPPRSSSAAHLAEQPAHAGA